MTKQRFTPEFADEAVRLAHTSGRTQREIAEDLGIGLSTLVRWIGRSRDRLIDTPAVPSGEEDSTAELKRLRRENEIALNRCAVGSQRITPSPKFYRVSERH
jgi:transposase